MRDKCSGPRRGSCESGGPLSSRPRLRSPRARQRAAPPSCARGGRGNRFSRTSPPGRHSLERAERARARAWGWGAPGRPGSGVSPVHDRGSRASPSSELLLRPPSPGVSARPGRGGRVWKAGCRGAGRAGARGGNPRLGLPLPGALSLSPRGACDWQPVPVTHSPRVHIPEEGSRKVINLHQATFPIT